MLTHHIFGDLRRVARCGLGASGQPDTAIVQHSYDKRKGQGLGPGFAPPGGGVKGGEGERELFWCRVIAATKRAALIVLEVEFLGERLQFKHFHWTVNMHRRSLEDR
jgi:hypothetical protein